MLNILCLWMMVQVMLVHYGALFELYYITQTAVAFTIGCTS